MSIKFPRENFIKFWRSQGRIRFEAGQRFQTDFSFLSFLWEKKVQEHFLRCNAADLEVHDEAR